MISGPIFMILLLMNWKQRSRTVSSPVAIWLKMPVKVPRASYLVSVMRDWCTCCNSATSSEPRSCAKISAIRGV
uniref:Putative secreted protein n=1 Tax=Anopheles marajoara TaxID=58244 RepID=A0A2M4CEK3_9DIPT